MAYATAEDLIQRLGGFYRDLYADSDGRLQVCEAAADIAAASAEIDGRIGKRYQIPVSAPAAGELLKHWALTLAEELAWSRSGQGETPENVRARAAEVRRMLNLAAEGTMVLPGAVAAPEADAAALLVEGDEPIFRRHKMERF